MSFAATATLGFGATIAGPLAVINIGEAMLSVALIDRMGGRRREVDGVRRLAAYVISAELLAPAFLQSQRRVRRHPSTGLRRQLLPLVRRPRSWCDYRNADRPAVARGDMTRWCKTASLSTPLQTAAALAAEMVTALFVFRQTTMPLLFLPMLPVMVATFRAGRVGAAFNLIIVAIVGGWVQWPAPGLFRW